MKTSREFYGVGVEWTEQLENDILSNLDRISCFEFIPENFFGGRGEKYLRAIGDSQIPVLVHGVELSLGTAGPLKQDHLDKILRVADQVNMVNLSDHLAMTEAGGVEIGQLTPFAFTQESCDEICRKIDQIQRQLKVPFLIENISNRFEIPFCEMSEIQFINKVLSRTGCGLLLDLNNLHTNATNFKYNPLQWLEELNSSAVRAIHLAGGVYDDEGTLVDSHNASVPMQVWDLYRHVCRYVRPEATIVEWTDDCPPYSVLLKDVQIANGVLAETLSEEIQCNAGGR